MSQAGGNVELACVPYRGQILLQFRLEWKKYWRNPVAAASGFVMPLIVLTAVISIAQHGGAGSAENQLIASYFVASSSSLGLISVFLGAGITLVNRRASGLLRRTRVLPIHMSALFFALGLVLLVNSCVVVLMLNIFGRLVFDAQTSPRPGYLLLALLLGASAFSAISFAILGYVRSPQTAPAIVNLLVFPLVITSGILTSSNQGTIGKIGDVLPGRPFVQLMLRGLDVPLNANVPPLQSVLVLTAWTLVAGVLASFTYRREFLP